MRTQKLTLYYKVTPEGIVPPEGKEVERRQHWLDDIKRTIPSGWEYQLVRVQYELFNPHVENQRKFFHICVLYYAIQDMDMFEGAPDSDTVKKYREEILDDMLGYDVQLIKRTIRQRTSTATFKTVQKWHTFLKELEETQFADAGYEFPDSEHYWELVRKHGHSEGRRIAIEQLQERMKKRYDTR